MRSRRQNLFGGTDGSGVHKCRHDSGSLISHGLDSAGPWRPANAVSTIAYSTSGAGFALPMTITPRHVAKSTAAVTAGSMDAEISPRARALRSAVSKQRTIRA